jgi:hypothetical protein
MIRKPASDIDAAANYERLPGAGFCVVIVGLSNPMDCRAAGREPDRRDSKGTILIAGFIVLLWRPPADPADPDIMALSV